MALIEMKNVVKAYYENKEKNSVNIALNGINLAVDEGEFVSLLGPSGCGKTVTLNLIAGFERPTTGSVLFRGAPVEKPATERGVVFQEYSLLPWLSVLENVMFALGTRDMSKVERRACALEALRVVGLSEAVDMRPNVLSGGMKQRVAIARLLAMDSSVFLMDEPFSALDEQTREALDDEVVNLRRRRGKTVVFVTHNISEAVRVSSRIVLYSGNPGTIVKEWRIPDSLPRDSRSGEARAIREEIKDLLPLHGA